VPPPIDLGSSTFGRTATRVGTPGYMAPEVDAGELYGPEVDAYALGVLLHAILTGHMPLPNLTLDAPSLVGEEWAPISAYARDAVAGLLHPLPAHRTSVDQLLAHPWMRQVQDDEDARLRRRARRVRSRA
jgi:serine/threonine protein kinase